MMVPSLTPGTAKGVSLVRAMEIQSHGLLEKEKQTGRYFKGVSATAMLKNFLETSQSILTGSMSLGEQGLPGWEARAVGMGHGKDKEKESLSAAQKQQDFELLPDDKGNSSHKKKLGRTCPGYRHTR